VRFPIRPASVSLFAVLSIRHKLGTHWDGRPLIQTIHRRGYLLLQE
jgi:DNA-binding response OmpR family regulator